MKTPQAYRESRAAFTLLEVLVACGILVVSLASIAAILPATAARLGEATAMDRAAALAQIAMGEVTNRQLVSRDLSANPLMPAGVLIGEWAASDCTYSQAGNDVTVTSFGHGLQVGQLIYMEIVSGNGVSGFYYVFSVPNSNTIRYKTPQSQTQGSQNAVLWVPPSDGLTGVAQSAALSSGYPNLILWSSLSATNGILSNASQAVLSLAVPWAQNRVIATRQSREFVSQDNVQFSPPSTGSTPLNLFGGITGTTGFRQFSREMNWSALLTPEPWGTAFSSMTAVRASVAVFRKPSVPIAMTLRQQGGAFATGTWPGAIQRTRLRACSSVLALPWSAAVGTPPPQWLRINSSWTSGTDSTATLDAITTGSAVAYVTFDRDPPSGLITASGFMTVLTFDSLLITDQKVLPLR